MICIPQSIPVLDSRVSHAGLLSGAQIGAQEKDFDMSDIQPDDNKPTYEQIQSELDKARVQLARIMEEVNRENELSRSFRDYGTLADHVRDAFAWYHNKHNQVIGGAKDFNNELIVYFRAIALVAETVANAGTHKEKDARLRGLISQIETALQKLRDQSFDFERNHYWRSPSIWRSDYSIQEYIDRNRQLEQEVNSLKEQLYGPTLGEIKD